MSQHSQDSSPLLQLPTLVLQQIAFSLSDPGALAVTCRATAALLSQEELLLDWAHLWLPRLTASDTTARHRHPGYALLHWHRLRCWDTPRVAAVLLRWVAKQQMGSGRQTRANTSGSSGSGPAPGGGSIQRAQQLLDGGDAVGALRALLPFSQPLLLLYAAQAGHVRVLRDLLKVPALYRDARLEWDEANSAHCDSMLRPALFAAVCCGHVDAMTVLVSAMQTAQEVADKAALRKLCTGLLHLALTVGKRALGSVQPLLQLLGGMRKLNKACQAKLLVRAAEDGDAAAVSALLGAGMACDFAYGRPPIKPPAGSNIADFGIDAGGAYGVALKEGHFHLLALLRPADMDDGEAALQFCEAAEQEGIFNLLRRDSQQLEVLLLDAWRAVGTRADGSKQRCKILRGLLRCNNEAALCLLRSIWAAYPAAVDRASLATTILGVWAGKMREIPRPYPEIGQWVLGTVLPALDSLPAAERATVLKGAALCLLEAGQMQLLEVLQPSAATAAVVAEELEWQQAQLRGQLYAALRRGDAAATSVALGALGGGADMIMALSIAAASPDAAQAEALIRALAPYVNDPAMLSVDYWTDDEYTDNGFPIVTVAHGGSMVKLLCELSLAVCQGVLAVEALVDMLYLHNIDMAQELIMLPTQRTTLLNDLCEHEDLVDDVTWPGDHLFFHTRTFDVSGCTLLLHRLAQAHRAASVNEQGICTKQLPPIGARELRPLFLECALQAGEPDLLQALLEYICACHETR